MTRMTGPDCAVMCNLTNTHTLLPWEDQCEGHRMTRMTGPDCAVMRNLINIPTHTHLPSSEDQCECHRMTRTREPDCVVMCNSIYIYTHAHRKKCRKERVGPVAANSANLENNKEAGRKAQGRCCCCFLTLTDPLRIQPWSQDRRNQTKSNRESEMSMESIQKRTGKK